MRYATENRGRKYVEGYGFLSFARNLGSRTSSKAGDAIVKHGKDAAVKAGKRALSKTAKATGDLVGQKIADKITRSRTKSNTKPDIGEQPNITPEQRQQIIDELRLISKV